MDKYLLYHDLLEAVQHDQCPVCRLVDERIGRLIKVLLREGAGDGQIVHSYVRAKGYCNAHAWRVKESGEPSSQAAFYRALLEGHKESLERYVNSRRRREDDEPRRNAGLHHRFKELLQTRAGRAAEETRHYLDSFASEERCPLCVAAESHERRYVESVAEYFEGDEEFRERYRNRGMLCHPHFRRLIEEHADRPGLPELMEIQLSRLDRQIEHLRELERTSAVRSSEEEGSARLGGWIRAIRLDVGLPGTDTRYKLRTQSVQTMQLKR